jgi:hypothetical protein
MGRTIRSSTLPIPHPWSLHTLSRKSHFAVCTGTWSSTFPSATQPAAFTLNCQGNQGPYVGRTHSSYHSMSKEGTSHKLGSLKLPTVPLSCTPWSPSQQPGPRTPAAHRLGSPLPAAATMAPTAWHQQTLNVNGLNAPIKRHRIATWVKNKTQPSVAYKTLISLKIIINWLRVKGWKNFPRKWTP